ncbi:MAG TPA: triose-phosphate isomerase [Candidatus Saccharimonadales bacterium]|nr:triose-phosphate isomerase [Candidatus Saccharimonadales bacterium]
MTRKTLIVANWKMDLNVSQASLLTHRLEESIRIYRDIEVVLAPTLLALQPVSMQIDRRKFRLAAQNAYFKDEGPYTGEVSFSMLRDLVHYVIVGHSERRIYFHEDLPMIRDKVAAAIRNGITPILCVGETQHERTEGLTRRVLHDQVTTALHNLTAREVRQMVIAYEPVWAISTFQGGHAKPDEVADCMHYIRKQIAGLYGEHVAEEVRVLYGGSVDDTTVWGYLAIDGCDGALVGGASLNPYKFAGIVEAAYRLQHHLQTHEN